MTGTGTTRSVLEIAAETYHADEIGHDQPSLSASIVHELITSSPRHAWAKHPRLNPNYERKTESKFDVGTVAHALLLQGTDIVEVVEADSWRTKAAKDAAMIARAAGRIPLLPDQWEEVQAMVSAAREQVREINRTLTPPLFHDGAPEQTLVWVEDNGVVCRCRLDWLHTDVSAIDDWKTTGVTANPRTWARRTMFAIGADIQIAFYLRGVAACFPELRQPPKWRYVLIETSPPFELSIVEPDAGILEIGRLKVEEAIETWALCLEKDFWPGYPKEPYRAELPAWVEAEWLEGREAA